MQSVNFSNTKCQIFATLVLLITVYIEMAESCRGGTLLATGVSEAEKYQILASHNQLRSRVAQGLVPGQPGAQNMREMVWDEELAAKAQQWANQCTFQHDPSRYLDRFTMGQNLAIIWSTAELGEHEGSFPSRVQNWFNEVQKYAWGARWSPKTGHYSQLVWGETNLVGCGFAYYRDHRRFNKLYVCNYGPGGNVVGSAPYEVGQPSCQSHGMQSSSSYAGLCVGTSHSYAPNHDIITHDTYTFKSEHVNPTVYHTIKTSTIGHPDFNTHSDFGLGNDYNPFSYKVHQPTYAHQPAHTAVQSYQNALQAYHNPHQSLDSAQNSYQLALQAYSAAYPSHTTTHATTSPYFSTHTHPVTAGYTTGAGYDWSSYFG